MTTQKFIMSQAFDIFNRVKSNITTRLCHQNVISNQIKNNSETKREMEFFRLKCEICPWKYRQKHTKTTSITPARLSESFSWIKPLFQTHKTYIMSILFTVLLFLISVFLLLSRRERFSSAKNLPPGSLGLPVIGQSLSLLRQMRANTAEKWLQERIDKYGPVSKMSLFGKPTVFIHGQAANKVIFASNESVIANQQAKSMQMIMGDRNLLELNGDDHKRVRSALMLFLKPESLKQYVGKMEYEIRLHLETYWQSKQQVTVTLLTSLWIQYFPLSKFLAITEMYRFEFDSRK